MRAMWHGAISFGLVTIAVRLFAATEEHDFRFHQVHREDGGRIRYKRVCQVCGEEVAYADIAKGYELEDGRMVVLDREDFEKLPISTDRAIEVVEFVPTEEIDPIFFQKSYYLEPDKAAVRPYVLLRTALERADRLAVVKITMRQRQSLAMVRARDDVLVLHTMMWPDEIRRPDFGFLDGEVEVRPQELKMAESLIESMAGTFEPGEFTDDYRDAMAKLVEAKAEGAELPAQPEDEDSGEVIDLMAALERSVAQAKASRAETTTKKTKKAPAKKSGKSKSA
ncbi:non-homologous end joining protein Ku, partial [Allokutzneria albata]|uniref:Non-homologous end joining protein Ku n=1 Tax=Allokutzneria albata TaxID=211114 RepID=A0A1G9TAD5_ALLAB